MIKINFVNGSNLRRVLISNRTISFHDMGKGIPPIIVNLDKIEGNKMFHKLNDEEKRLLKECQALQSEQDIANDIKMDFQKSGWRMFTRQ